MDIFVAKFVGASGKEKINVEKFDAEDKGGKFVARRNGIKRVFLSDEFGKPNMSQGVGVTSADAVRALRDGAIVEANRLDAEVSRLIKLASVPVA